MEFCDPNKVHLRLPKPEINADTEEKLIETDPANWTPILLHGTRVIDGNQRVLVARKHSIPSIPCRRQE
jgi:hypothetical protein